MESVCQSPSYKRWEAENGWEGGASQSFPRGCYQPPKDHPVGPASDQVLAPGTKPLMGEPLGSFTGTIAKWVQALVSLNVPPKDTWEFDSS